MELFGIREASRYGLVSQAIQVLSGFTKTVQPNPLFTVFPYMAGNDFLFVLGSCTRLEQRTILAMFRVRFVFPVAFPVRSRILEFVFGRTYIHVLFSVELEQGGLLSVAAWYDNERGYASRLAEVAAYLAARS